MRFFLARSQLNSGVRLPKKNGVTTLVMKNSYKISPDIIERVAKPAEKTYYLLFILALFGLLIHLANSVLSRPFELSLLLIGLFMYGIFAFIGYRNAKNQYQLLSSFEVEIDDETISCKQLNKLIAKIHKDEIVEVQEIGPNGDLIINTARRENRVCISKYLEGYQEIKLKLEKWHKIKPVSRQKVHLQAIVLMTVIPIIGSYMGWQLGVTQVVISFAPLLLILLVLALVMYRVMPDSNPFLKQVSLVLIVPIVAVTTITVAAIVY
jgi:hypothetical protein